MKVRSFGGLVLAALVTVFSVGCSSEQPAASSGEKEKLDKQMQDDMNKMSLPQNPDGSK